MRGVFSALLPKRAYKIFKPAVDLLAGIPSIVYGFFGLVVIVPAMQNLFGGSGKSVLTASVMLGIMILPTIISVSEAAIRAVPESYYEGALALGAHARAQHLQNGAARGEIGNYGGRYFGNRQGHRRGYGG